MVVLPLSGEAAAGSGGLDKPGHDDERTVRLLLINQS
jgi:hypothetical protein